MTNKFLKFCLVTHLYICSAAVADIALLQKIMEQTKSITADFTQTVFDNMQNIVEVSTGKFVLKKPHSVVWETMHPNKQLIVKNHEKLWIYDEDLEQVTIQDIKKIEQITILDLLLKSNFSYTKHFKINHNQNKEINSYTLTPKTNDFDFSKLILTFRKNKLTDIVIYDPFDATTKITFSKILLNKNIADAMFSFKAPDGIDLIYQ